MKLTDEQLAEQYELAAQNLENIPIPGQVKPTWEQISAGLDRLLTTKEEEQNQ